MSSGNPLKPMIMENVVSYCGIICQGCPVLWATREEDKEVKHRMRIEIARLSNEMYQSGYGPEDISDCDGCMSESGRLFQGCSECPIRNCALEKELLNCAYCEEYNCEKLEAIFKESPEPKIRLDFIKSLVDSN
jgi:hypothetical protein